MAAWRFWLLFLAEFLVVGSAARWLGATWPGVLGTALAWLIAIRVLLLAAFFLMSWRLSSPYPPEARLGYAGVARFVLEEIRATLLAFFYLHPVAERFNRDPRPGEEGTPVLFVHGFLSNAGFWHPIRRFLTRSGLRHHYAVTLGPPLAPLDDLAAVLAQEIERVHTRARVPLTLVAHSMGGLIARACLDDPVAHSRVRKLVTLGTPHHGSVAARCMFGANTRQMRPGSDWLRLHAASPKENPAVPVVSVYSYHDNIVMPQSSSVLPRARNIGLPGLGHMAMAFDPRIRALLVEELSRETENRK